MRIVKTIEEVRLISTIEKQKDQEVGLIPTMGALHEGHLSLVKKAIAEKQFTIVSIFVNPIQFNNQSDLTNYPSTIDKDVSMLESVGCDVVFIPSEKEMYSEKPVITMQFGLLEMVMEGAYRPGHFSGVGIIVAKLFNIIQPTNAYFGQKDLQQFLIIKQLVKDLSIHVKVHCCPILREPDGLAMSSRNVRITKENRAVAAKINEMLVRAEKMLRVDGIEKTKRSAIEFIAQFDTLKLEYFEIVDGDTLEQITTIEPMKKIALCTAVYLDEVRLIDNLLVE